jgi:hypothetical protein
MKKTLLAIALAVATLPVLSFAQAGQAASQTPATTTTKHKAKAKHTKAKKHSKKTTAQK